MAVYRQIQITFWQDKFILCLTPEEKFFYLYLLTNSKTKQSGVYELPIKIIEIETGYNRETVTKLIQRFIEHEKINFDWENEEICLLNWLKHNPYDGNRNIKKCIENELKSVKNPGLIPNDSPLKPLISPLQGGSQKEKEKEKEKEKKQKEKKEGGALSFPEILFSDFCLAYKLSRGYEFTTVNTGKETKAIGQLLSVLKKKFPDFDSEQMRDAFKGLFLQSLSVTDKWYYENISPSFIANNISKIETKIRGNNANSLDSVGQTFADAFTSGN